LNETDYAPIGSLTLGASIYSPKHSYANDESISSETNSNSLSFTKIVKLILLKEDGSIADIEVLRSEKWLIDNSIRLPGDELLISEGEIRGHAIVTSISDFDKNIDKINMTNTSIVIGKITHRVARTVEVKVVDLQGEIKQIHGTADHPIWSWDRSEWIGLGFVNRGEALKTLNGKVFVVDVYNKKEASPVVNIEVYDTHTFFVSGFGVMAHNIDLLCRAKKIKNKIVNKVRDPFNFRKTVDDVLSPDDFKTKTPSFETWDSFRSIHEIAKARINVADSTSFDVLDKNFTASKASYRKDPSNSGLDVLYFLWDRDTRQILKVGKTSVDTWRFSPYKTAARKTDRNLQIDIFVFDSGNATAESFEGAIRRSILGGGTEMRWDMTGTSGGSGIPGVRNSKMRKNKITWDAANEYTYHDPSLP
jgi:predicted CoA-binding protein